MRTSLIIEAQSYKVLVFAIDRRSASQARLNKLKLGEATSADRAGSVTACAAGGRRAGRQSLGAFRHDEPMRIVRRHFDRAKSGRVEAPHAAGPPRRDADGDAPNTPEACGSACGPVQQPASIDERSPGAPGRSNPPPSRTQAMNGETKKTAGPRVLLNLVRLLPSEKGAGGAGRLALALLTHLPQRVSLRVAISYHWRSLIDAFPNVTFEVAADDSNETLRRQLAWCDCYIDPLNGLRPTVIDPRIAVISFVLDLQHLRMPWLYTQEQMAGRIAEYGYAIDRSDWLVAISAYERDNFAAFYGVDRVTVAHLAGFMAEDSGLSPRTIRARRAEADKKKRPYLVYPAVPWPHKNHDILIQAVAILARRGLTVPLALTNTSSKPEEKERLSALASGLGVEDQVDLHGFLDEAALLDLIISSRGMVFPSLYEGFGIPLVDAMALGVPLLVNPTAAVPEICGDAAAKMSNANNAIVLADEMAAFWNDTSGRRKLAERGFERATKFSSSKMVGDLVGAIDAAVAAKAKRSLPPASRLDPPQFHGLAVFVAYADLDQKDRERLRGVTDLAAWHARAFGETADVTVGLDIALMDDPVLAQLFATAPKLIIFDGRSPEGFEAAVQDFSGRYDQAALHLVTAYARGGLDAYRADMVRAATLALNLYSAADCALPDPEIQDCLLEEHPGEAEGVLAYHRRRGAGLAVTDMLLRRSSARGLRNGTVAFLSEFCTRYRRLRVPIVRPRAEAPNAVSKANVP